MIGFSPRLRPEHWQSFWSTGTGWGTFSQRLHDGRAEASLCVEQGGLALRELHLGSVGEASGVQAAVNGQSIEVTLAPRGGGVAVHFPDGASVAAGQILRVSLQR